jgi:DNA polymerase III sliding clamp (beta) subunit (PCNA family)
MENVQKFKAAGTKHLMYPWFNAVADLVGEARMSITDQGINITCVDPANVAMLIANISTKQFETFKTTADAENLLILGIDFTRYTPIMRDKQFIGTELFLFEALPPKEVLKPAPESGTEEESSFNKQYIDSKYRHKLMFSVMNVSYKYETLDPKSIRKKPKVPKFDSPIEIVMPISELDKAKRAMANANQDHMKIDVEFWSESSNKPVLRMWNNALDEDEEVKVEIPTSELTSFKYTGQKHHDQTIGSLYSLDYLNDIIRCLKGFGGAGDVKIKLGQDFPIIISMEFDDKSSISYLLAPRIESD